MDKPTLYKKVPVSTVTSKTTSSVSAEELTTARNTLTKFFELFLAKHT